MMTHAALPDLEGLAVSDEHYAFFANLFGLAFPQAPESARLLKRARLFTHEHSLRGEDDDFWSDINMLENALWEPKDTIEGLVAQVIMLVELIIGGSEVSGDSPPPRAIAATLMRLASRPPKEEMH